MENNLLIKTTDQVKSIIKKRIYMNKPVNLLNRLLYLTSENLNKIDLSDLTNLLVNYQNKENVYLGLFSGEFSKQLLLRFKPKNFNQLINLMGFDLSNGTYKNNAEILCKDLDIFTIPSYKENLIYRFNILDKHIINKVNTNQFDDELKSYFKNFKFSKNCAKWAYNYVSKIKYLSSLKEISLRVVLGLYLFYFYFNYNELYIFLLKDYDSYR